MTPEHRRELEAYAATWFATHVERVPDDACTLLLAVDVLGERGRR